MRWRGRRASGRLLLVRNPVPHPPQLPPTPLLAELLARIEAHPDNQLSAQDMEIAVSKALEQAV